MIEEEDEDGDDEEKEEDDDGDEDVEGRRRQLKRMGPKVIRGEGGGLFGRDSEGNTRGGSAEGDGMRHAASMEMALMAQSVEGFDGAIGEAIWVDFRCSGVSLVYGAAH